MPPDRLWDFRERRKILLKGWDMKPFSTELMNLITTYIHFQVRLLSWDMVLEIATDFHNVYSWFATITWTTGHLNLNWARCSSAVPQPATDQLGCERLAWPHFFAQPTTWRFLPKSLSQLVIFVTELAFTWSWVNKNHQSLIFKANFLCQNSVLWFLVLFLLRLLD